MKKKIIIATMLAALAAVPVFAAATDQIQPQNEINNQMFNNHQQMVQQAVDNGTMTADQATQMNEHMQQMAPVMQKMMQDGGMMKGNVMGNGNMMNILDNRIHFAQMMSPKEIETNFDSFTANGVLCLNVQDRYGLDVRKDVNFIVY